MFARLLFLFVTVPVVELFLILQLNEWTQSWATTIAITLFTGFLGAWLAKQQGLSTVLKIQQALGEGRMPATELVDGGMILFAGALLLTPGILTDAFGFSLLIPPCRVVYRRLLKKLFPAAKFQFHAGGTGFPGGHNDHGSYEPADPNVLDGTATPSQDADSDVGR